LPAPLYTYSLPHADSCDRMSSNRQLSLLFFYHCAWMRRRRRAKSPELKHGVALTKPGPFFFFTPRKLSLTALGGGGGVARRAAAAFARAVASISAISAISAISSFSRSRSAAAGSQMRNSESAQQSARGLVSSTEV